MSVNPMRVEALTQLHRLDWDTAREIVSEASPEERQLARSLNLLAAASLLADAGKSKVYALGRAAEYVLPFWPKDGGGLRDALEAAREAESPAYCRAVEWLRRGGWTEAEVGHDMTLPDEDN